MESELENPGENLKNDVCCRLESGLGTTSENCENFEKKKMVKIVYAAGWCMGWVPLVKILKIVKMVYAAGLSVGWVFTPDGNCEIGVFCWLDNGLGNPLENFENSEIY